MKYVIRCRVMVSYARWFALSRLVPGTIVQFKCNHYWSHKYVGRFSQKMAWIRCMRGALWIGVNCVSCLEVRLASMYIYTVTCIYLVMKVNNENIRDINCTLSAFFPVANRYFLILLYLNCKILWLGAYLTLWVMLAVKFET